MPQQQTITARDGTILDAGVVNLAKAMRTVESNNNYNSRGKSGEFGAFQWMPDTWQKHAQMAGVDPNDRSPVNQDKVAYKVIEARKKAGLTPEQIVSEWNSGKANAFAQGHRGVNSLGVAFDTPAHVQKVIAEFQKNKGTTPPQQVAEPVNPDSLKADLLKRKEQFSRSQERVEAGEISPERGLLRAAGAGAGALGDVGMRALSAVTPDVIGEPLAQAARQVAQNALGSTVGKAVTPLVQKFAQKYPEATQDIKDVANIAGVVPIGFGGGVAAKASAKSTGKALTGIAERSAEKQVSGLAKDYADIFGTRSPLRGRVDRAAQKGRDLSTFLAEKAKGINGAKLEVDSDGNVDPTKLIAKNEEDVQTLYQARKDLLKQYPEQADVEKFRELALKSADTAENRGKAIVGELQNDINGIFDQLKMSFGDRVPLEVLQDIKIAQRLESKAFNALKPKRDRFSNANYIVSDTARKYIEDITQNPLVREVNDLIGAHLEADDLLERIKIGGAKVKGGRLGKYAGMGIGAMIGGAAESMAGPLLGGLAGNYAVGLILKNQVSGPLRNFLLKKIEVESPEVYKKIQDFIGAEELRRSQMLQLPAEGQSSFREPTIYGNESGLGSPSLQEAIDAAPAQKGLIKPPRR